MAPAPEGEVGHFERGLGRVQVHHPHNPPEEVTGSVQHDTSKERYPCCVADKKEGGISLEVEVEDWGQDDHCDRSLEQFESGHSSEELDMWHSVNHSVLLCGQVRISDQGCDFRDKGFLEPLMDGCGKW